MTILLIGLFLIAASVVVYKFKTQTPKIAEPVVPEKIEIVPAVDVKPSKKADKEEPKKIKKTVKKVNKNTK